jgi:nucleoside phosphorylase
MPPAENGECVVLCPLEFERRAVERALMAAGAGLEHVRIVRTGPGPRRVREAVSRLVTVHGKPSLAILAGVAGGLADEAAPASAPVLERVTDLSGNEWMCRLAAGGGSALRADTVAGPAGDDADRVRGADGRFEESARRADLPSVVGVDQPVFSARDKRALRERTGAFVVDTESHEFARACDAAGVRWAVVRGVSDGPDDALPRQAARWVTEDGLTRPWRVAATLASHPWQVGRVARLGRCSSRAMRAVGGRVAGLIQVERARVLEAAGAMA